MDVEDRPLNEGGAYFAHYGEFLKYEEEVVKTAPQVGLFRMSVRK